MLPVALSHQTHEPQRLGLARAAAYAPPTDEDLHIIYQDASLIAFNKPAGLLSVPGRGAHLQDCALHRVQLRFPTALLVHRLDEATSGLLLFALSPAAQKALCIAFEMREIHKTYVAHVHGISLPSSGLIDAPIAVDWPNRPLRRVDAQSGKRAVTHFRLLSKDERLAQSVCRLEPETGRTHQLRVHLQHIGHPIVGDLLYGEPEHIAPRLMLHASGLRLQHPLDRATLLNLESVPPF
jgi:tRNA pseudouridine32 synthase / 23S rRNA pseudouridine746 synthase